MRKKRLMIAIACIILVGIAVIVFFSQQGKKPYKDLDAAQIVSAKVLLTPANKTIEIENIQELVEYLNDVVVYNEDNSYTEYDGQGVVFTLTMVDGTQTDIMAYNPFIVIDGIGYKTKYEPCEALNSYANELLNSVVKLKPSSAKGTYVKSVTMSSTMSPGTIIDTKSFN